ncbi:DNA oxidative demethylase ALKBH2 isoform X1 [Telopea speciosissima]|uniref:DNA oxidative demethylase ALKBH2 isoform X1 n=1 Tax=Telopea speciosissima TaxID=54955 RepID=UPI001CC439DB|nr:DNA oxidative demethylase ALKBH2 isoform X1 [Telopea speciosissima]
MSSSMNFKFQARSETMNPNPSDREKKRTIDLGNGSEIIYFPRIISFGDSWKLFHYLDKEIPWTRPSIQVFGRSCIQPRDTCYVASEGLPELRYSGYKPRAYPWDDYPPLKDLLAAVHEALPGSSFNSLLLNRYKSGSDNVAWHSDYEKLYGPTPEIASLSFGCDREFLLRKKRSKSPKVQVASASCMEEPAKKRLKKNNQVDQHSLTLKHGSLLVMRGYTQRDWDHSVPKRAKIEAVRINLTFRRVLKI